MQSLVIIMVKMINLKFIIKFYLNSLETKKYVKYKNYVNPEQWEYKKIKQNKKQQIKRINF